MPGYLKCRTLLGFPGDTLYHGWSPSRVAGSSRGRATQGILVATRAQVCTCRPQRPSGAALHSCGLHARGSPGSSLEASRRLLLGHPLPLPPPSPPHPLPPPPAPTRGQREEWQRTRPPSVAARAPNQPLLPGVARWPTAHEAEHCLGAPSVGRIAKRRRPRSPRSSQEVQKLSVRRFSPCRSISARRPGFGPAPGSAASAAWCPFQAHADGARAE